MIIFDVFIIMFDLILFHWTVSNHFQTTRHFLFRSDEEEENEDKNAVPITSFFGEKKVQQKTPFFDDRSLVATTTI